MPASRENLLDRGGPWLAAAAAAFAALPGLTFPFLSDDWHLVEWVMQGAPPATAYGYFRPLYTGTFWLDCRLWGASPFGFHLTNLLLMAAAAFMVVILVRRYTCDGPLSALTGILFALHPYHVENAAWIAVRGDPLYSTLFLGSAWAYDRWRTKDRRFAQSTLRAPLPDDPGRSSGKDPGDAAPGAKRQAWPLGLARAPLPLTALVLFELALLAKETAVVLPALLLLVLALSRIVGRGQDAGLAEPGVVVGSSARTVHRSRRLAPEARAELVRGVLPMALIALVHFVLLRTLVVAGEGRSLTPGTAVRWVRHALGYVVAAVLPIDAEILADSPLPWGTAAALGVAILFAAAWRRQRPVTALAASAAFLLLLAPSIIGFQERYLFLPVAASSLALASLAAALRPRSRVAVTLLLLVVWTAGCVRHWRNWSEAAVASRHLVADLVAASANPDVHEIAVANVPFRVRGGSVAGDLRAAISLGGGRPVPVKAATYVSYPGSSAPEMQDGPGGRGDRIPRSVRATGQPSIPTLSVVSGRGFSEVRMGIPDRPFSHYVAPIVASGGSIRTPVGTVVVEGETVVARIDEAPLEGRAAYAWANGRLVPLFLPPKEPPRGLAPPP